jgi:hypothetical protein
MDQNLVARIRQQKELAYRNRSKRNWLLLAGVLVGTFLAVGWFVILPQGLPPPITKLVIGVGLGTVFGIWLMFRLQHRVFPASATCPQCGYSWEIKEGRSARPQDRMPNWDRCPGCGLLMSEALIGNDREAV